MFPMPTSRLWRRLQWSLVLLAALGTTALPLLGHAMMRAAAQAPAGWVEVCTSKGVQWVSPDSPEAQSTPATPVTNHHGGCCCDALLPVLGLPTAVTVPAIPAAQVPATSSVSSAPSAQVAWTRPWGRAPPLLRA